MSWTIVSSAIWEVQLRFCLVRALKLFEVLWIECPIQFLKYCCEHYLLRTRYDTRIACHEKASNPCLILLVFDCLMNMLCSNFQHHNIVLVNKNIAHLYDQSTRVHNLLSGFWIELYFPLPFAKRSKIIWIAILVESNMHSQLKYSFCVRFILRIRGL